MLKNKKMLDILSLFIRMISETSNLTNGKMIIESGNNCDDTLRLLMKSMSTYAEERLIDIPSDLYVTKFLRYRDFKDLCTNVGLVTSTRREYAVIKTLPMSDEILEVYSEDPKNIENRMYSVKTTDILKTAEGFSLHRNIIKLSRGPLKTNIISLAEDSNDIFVNILISNESQIIRFGLVGYFNIYINLADIGGK